MAKNWYKTPIDETKEGRARLDAYYSALGKFVDRFSKVENTLRFVIWHYSSLQRDVANALLFGVRVDGTYQLLSRLHEIGKISDPDWLDLDGVLSHLKLITKCRNDILHHGAIKIAEGKGEVLNAMVALTQDRLTSFPISDETLGYMYNDLRKILVRLLIRHAGRPSLRGDHPELKESLHGAWQYKLPPTPVVQSRKSPDQARKGRPTHKDQPKSSPV